jgi:Fuc2NAc and GlcNAc transferase
VVSATLTLLVGGFVATLLLEWLVLRLVRHYQLLAIPNARSSHVDATPTLGGIAIVLTVCGYLLSQVSAGVDPAVGLLLGGGLLAIVGFGDDIRDLSALVRLACQVVAVALVLVYLSTGWSWWLLGLVAFLLVWQVNLYNFMDGIDGIAGAQVLVFCTGVTLVTGGVPGWLGELVWLLLGSALGFLAFNWPPAKIFMGDVGSGFLGLVLGFLVVTLAEETFLPLVASLILLAGFWFDASYTLCVRIVTGQNFLSAHRSHIYQKLAMVTGHRATTAAFLLFGALWLVPLAWVSTMWPDWSLVCLAAAVLPLAVAAVRLRAGQPD